MSSRKSRGSEPWASRGAVTPVYEDCESACVCSENQCVPDGFGPSNPYRGTRPFHACGSISDCQIGCACYQGLCQPDGFSPANPNCNRAP